MTRFSIFFIIIFFVCGVVAGNFMKKSWVGEAEAQEVVVQEEGIQEIQEKEILNFEIIDVDITGYSPSPHITDSTPFEMSSGRVASPQELEQLKFIALSRDLLEKYNIKFDDEIWISFEVQDKMGPNATQGIDIFFRNLDLARKFGRQRRKVMILRNINP